MPFKAAGSSEQIAALVMQGKLPPDALESQKALKARQDAEAAAHPAHIMRECADGVSRVIPERILEAEAATGKTYRFYQFYDRQGFPVQGWYPEPPKPSAEIMAEIERTHRDFVFDFLAGKWVPEFRRPIPFEMQKVIDRFEISKDDPRYPAYNRTRDCWEWPPDQQTPAQEIMHRPDLESPHGYPLDVLPTTGMPGKFEGEGNE